jgi:hypothetical protein
MDWLSQLELNRESGTDSLRILIEHVKILRKDLLEVNRKVLASEHRIHKREYGNSYRY